MADTEQRIKQVIFDYIEGCKKVGIKINPHAVENIRKRIEAESKNKC